MSDKEKRGRMWQVWRNEIGEDKQKRKCRGMDSLTKKESKEWQSVTNGQI